MLKNVEEHPELFYVPYTPDAGCYIPAASSVAKVTPEPLIEGKYLKDPGNPDAGVVLPALRTWTSHTDAPHNKIDIQYDAERAQDVLGYAKSVIDRGMPGLVGVNEGGLISRDPVRPGHPRIYEGVTAHFVFIKGYQEEVQDGKWVVDQLYGMDDAPAEIHRSGTWPTFTSQDGGQIVKPEMPDGGAGAAALKYTVTEERVYWKDRNAVNKLKAWDGPAQHFVAPTPQPQH